METTRQKKISKLLQKDIAEILQNKLKKQGNYGVLLSITKVSVTVDFSVAKIFLSVFPSEMSQQVMGEVSKMSGRTIFGTMNGLCIIQIDIESVQEPSFTIIIN